MIEVQIFPGSLAPSAISDPQTLSDAKKYRALVDTGGETTRLSQKLIDDLALAPCSHRWERSGAEQHLATTFMVHLVLLFSYPPGGRYGIRFVEISTFGEKPDPPNDYDVILGRDCLYLADMKFSKEGAFTLTLDPRAIPSELA